MRDEENLLLMTPGPDHGRAKAKVRDGDDTAGWVDHICAVAEAAGAAGVRLSDGF
jgi:hypothetical protein